VFGLFEAHWQQDPISRDQNLTLFVAKGRINHTVPGRRRRRSEPASPVLA
jgi:hypothetical protein